jgi:hypothetical protein
MNPWTRTRDLLLTLILIQVFGILTTAVVAPTKFGQWMQKIDTGRFEYLDCDCTESLE